MIAAALAYAARLGWPVLPLRGKVPLTDHGVHDATVDAAAIAAWWHRWPWANVGISCNGLCVLDIDDRHALDTLGPLPATPVAYTGGGGLHYVFAGCSARNRVRAIPGVDVRAAGGYIVAAPSVHPDTGVVYAWDRALHPLRVPVATLPDRVLAMLNPPAQRQMISPPVQSGSRYVERALALACAAIAGAAVGSQEQTLHCEAYAIGRLTRCTKYADHLVAAGMRMTNAPGRRPWSLGEVERKVRRALTLGAGAPWRGGFGGGTM